MFCETNVNIMNFNEENLQLPLIIFLLKLIKSKSDDNFIFIFISDLSSREPLRAH